MSDDRNDELIPKNVAGAPLATWILVIGALVLVSMAMAKMKTLIEWLMS